MCLEGKVDIGEGSDLLRRTVPRTDDALALAEQVLALLGDRAWSDPLIGEGNLRANRLDDAHPGWVFPTPLISCDLQHQPHGFLLQGVDDAHTAAIRRRVDEERANILPPRRGHPCLLTVQVGRTVVQCTYDPGGWLAEAMRSEDHPILLGEPWEGLEELAERCATLDPTLHEHVRVHMPVLCPGGPGGAWLRLQLALGGLQYAQPPALQGGWLVYDGYTASTRGAGPTLLAAAAAWRAEVAAVLPLPPRDRQRAPDEPLPEPSQHTETTTDDETGETTTTMHATMVFVPRVPLDWPEADAAAVPAVAVRAPSLPQAPPEWADVGFHPIRLFGEHGEPGWALVRDQGEDGFVLVGERCVPRLDPARLEALFRAEEAHSRATWGDTHPPDWPNPWEQPEYPYVGAHGRVPEAGVLERTGGGCSAELQRPIDRSLHDQWLWARPA